MDKKYLLKLKNGLMVGPCIIEKKLTGFGPGAKFVCQPRIGLVDHNKFAMLAAVWNCVDGRKVNGTPDFRIEMYSELGNETNQLFWKAI